MTDMHTLEWLSDMMHTNSLQNITIKNNVDYTMLF